MAFARMGERAAALGFDGKAVVADAEVRAAQGTQKHSTFDAVRQIASVATQWAERLREWLKPGDPLVTSGLARLSLSANEIAAEMAVASAIRILGQREAAFPIHEISRTALDLGISGVTIEAVEARVRALADKGQLLYGTSGRSDGTVTHVTTPELLLESAACWKADTGRGAVAPVLSAGMLPLDCRSFHRSSIERRAVGCGHSRSVQQ
jgi:hypothetical protein